MALADMGIRVVGGAILDLEKPTIASVSVTRTIVHSSSVLSGVGCALSPIAPS